MRVGLACTFTIGWLALALVAHAAEGDVLAKLQAPPPMALRPLTPDAKAQPVKFVRAVVQLKPASWARVEIYSPTTINPVDYLTWTDGQIDVNTSTLSPIFSDELRAAGIPIEGASESLFSEDAAADLQVGVRITDIKGRFCKGCGWRTPLAAWEGAVTMDARWEIYSRLQGKVLVTVDTHGGFSAPKNGLRGDPELLVYEAFRDSARRLVASDDFRRVVTGAAVLSSPTLTPISFGGAVQGRRPIANTAESVAAVFGSSGFGSGFLISSEGYLLTNQHVVGGAKYVKVRWSDGSEVVGEVIRLDRRRDVALIKADPGARKPLALHRGPAQLGETAFAIGTPLDEKLQNTLTKGIVSGNRVYEGLSFIQSDVGVTHGNSGGPLLNEAGSVIGLTVLGLYPDESKSLNLFIPIDDALRALALTPAPE